MKSLIWNLDDSRFHKIFNFKLSGVARVLPAVIVKIQYITESAQHIPRLCYRDAPRAMVVDQTLTLRKTARIILLPTPVIDAHTINIALGLPTEQLARQGGIGIA